MDLCQYDKKFRTTYLDCPNIERYIWGAPHSKLHKHSLEQYVNFSNYLFEELQCVYLDYLVPCFIFISSTKATYPSIASSFGFPFSFNHALYLAPPLGSNMLGLETLMSPTVACLNKP